MTANGEIFAYRRGPEAFCPSKDPQCGWVLGPVTRRGCSRLEWGNEGYFIECCLENGVEHADSCDARSSSIMFDDSGTHFDCSPDDSVAAGDSNNCCEGSRAGNCTCIGVSPDCHITAEDLTSGWVDLITSTAANCIRIANEDWEQNSDDGWKHVDLGFYFRWFGRLENVITIGTNGVLSFGTGHLPHGGTEPVPCATDDTCATYSNDHVQMDGIIAPLWCDLDPTGTLAAAGEGVFYQIADETLPHLQRITIEWASPTFDHDDTLLHFEAILWATGKVVFQYLDIPSATESWSAESIGFEDHEGLRGVQIAYGTHQLPTDHTRYEIPESCHALVGGTCGTKCDYEFGQDTNGACACQSGCEHSVDPDNTHHQSYALLFQHCTAWCASVYMYGAGQCSESTPCDSALDDGNCNDQCNEG
eukprot:COSAG05_NODE_1111_length_5857_cov_6.789337_3_plen_419_part_00